MAERSSLCMDRLKAIVTEVYKAINGMSPDFLQDLFLIKANVHDLRDNNKMKVYKFKKNYLWQALNKICSRYSTE